MAPVREGGDDQSWRELQLGVNFMPPSSVKQDNAAGGFVVSRLGCLLEE
jgi:hypothetical protein